MLPLNGIKTHPLSAFALGKLRDISKLSVLRATVNPGVVDRLMRESLVEIVQAASPYKAHKGAHIDYLRITDAGRHALSTATEGERRE